MTSTALLDANVLIALLVVDHIHHDVAEEWYLDWPHGVASCPVTEGALVRLLIRDGTTSAAAAVVVESFSVGERHEFWPDDLSYASVRMVGVVGHRQVTDAYLAALARSRGARLVTLDRGLTAMHPDVAVLLDGD